MESIKSNQLESLPIALTPEGAGDAVAAPVVFFPALTSLRFFAAVFVFIYHIELYKFRCGIPNSWDIFAIRQFGPQGVNLFFVLSSFLLTTLLLQEGKHTRTISVHRFYMRRMLRIWPLYAVIIFIGFLIVPCCASHILNQRELSHFESTKPILSTTLVLYVLMLPNLALKIFTRLVALSHLWSIGVEEQFYLLLPLLAKAFITRPFVLLSVFCLSLTGLGTIADVLPTLDWVQSLPLSQEQQCSLFTICAFVKALADWWRMMLFGATASVLFMQGTERIRRLLYNSVIRVLIVVSIACFISIPCANSDLILGMLFSLLVFSLTDNRLRLMAWRPLVFLGTISYGIYMYHAIVLQCFMKLGETLSPTVINLLLYAIALPLLILISTLSYIYFERPFLQLKKRFATINSGKD